MEIPREEALLWGKQSLHIIHLRLGSAVLPRPVLRFCQGLGGRCTPTGSSVSSEQLRRMQAPTCAWLATPRARLRGGPGSLCKVQQRSEPQCSPLCSALSPAPHSKTWLPRCEQVPALLPHPVPPIIAAGPLELVVLEGLEVLLPCAARGVPEPRVSWSRDGALVRGGKAAVLPSGELLLRDVRVSTVP